MFRYALDQKAERTTASGVDIGGNNRHVDNHGDHRAAVAFRDPETGKIVAEARDFENMHRRNAEADEPATSDDNSTPRVEQLPGGSLRATVRREGLPLIKPSSAAEAKHHEEYIRKANERKQGAQPLPLIKQKDQK